ncbi:hypothetical protein INT45_013172 [Circinella minor]|uniref:Uncharacterized protein n=1 Tax=Circinella minor TaxID=1195481 RepID=A0A8H7RZ34_9FUNG|nr:hypothetical protein INT45_013172 [Circinella minor]
MKLPGKIPEEIFIYSKTFLEETNVEEWCLVNMDMALVQSNPGINKKTAHRYISEDLNTLEKLYPEIKIIQERVAFVRKELMKKNQGNSAGLKEFWGKQLKNYEMNVIRKKTNEIGVEASALNLTSAYIDNLALSRKREIVGESSSSKHRKMNTSSYDINNQVESDNMYLKPGGFSVGTTIKRHALLIHNDFKKGEKLTNRKRKIMVAGLSSILDLSDASPESQRSLFTDKEWSSMIKFFEKKFPLSVIELPQYLQDAITIISNTCDNNSLEKGFKYLYKLYATNKIDENKRSMLQILEHCLELMKDYQHLLNKSNNKPLYTEQDYFHTLWSRIFQLLFKSHKHIRIKSGESIPPIGTMDKQSQYPDVNNTFGFKVDARLVVDVNNKEYDLWAVEVAKDDSDPKVISDLGKLIREGKDNTDEIYTTLAYDGNEDDKMSWIIQVSGANCRFSSVHLARDGLYVILKRYMFNLPNSMKEFDKIAKDLMMLITFKVGDFNSTNIDNHIHWMRDTWYTPSQNARLSTVPANMFSRIDRIFSEEVVLTESEEDNEVEKEGEKEEEFSKVDEYGYRKVSNGWLNIFTKNITEQHPLQESDDDDDDDDEI